VKVWYKKPGDANWTIFGTTLTIRTPNIVAGAECTLESPDFIANGVPVRGTPGGQHLFCSTTLSDGGTPHLRRITDNTHRIWEWASKERPVCGSTFSDGSSVGTPTDFAVRAEVCNSSVGLESNCKNYSGTYKPNGLLQKYGEGTANEKVCSRVHTKSCNTDNDCAIATEGMCIDKSPMYFGFMSTSNTNNLSGGVLRKNFGSVTDETNINNGIFQTSENVSGNIIITFDRLKPVGFRYSDYSYQDASGGNCGWITTRPLNQGECRSWGNPIGEMMYESLRYMAGTGAPTAAFTYSTPSDSGLSLSKPDWGYNKGSTWFQPYQLYPPCARPFMLVLSDVNTSYDDDQIPGSAFASVSSDAALPNLNVSTLADIIGTQESIAGNNWFIGYSSGQTRDFMCTSKTVTNLSSIEGTCPEEPTKKGTYYAAAVSYYGKTRMQTNTGKPNADTFVIAMSSPIADMKIKASNNNLVTIIPIAKSVSGCISVNTACASKCTLTTGTHGLQVTNCSADSFCPSNQIVDVYVDDIRYDTSDNSVIYAKYRVNFEDVEQGADHDMDAIVTYEICTNDAEALGYGTCGTTAPDLSTGQIEVKLSSDYAAGCIDQVMGFVISGVGSTDDGVYLPVRDRDVSSTDGDTPAAVSGLPLTYSGIFTATGNSTALLKNPLWYAAKWGGFDDFDGDGKPFSGSSCGTGSPDAKCKEWDKDGDGTPDNYFLVVNPLKLEEQLNKALLAILTRASSGTAASVLASSEGRGANIVQALFHPRKLFDNDTAVEWAGQLHNLWYYIDPRLQTNTIREDSDGDRVENLVNDAQVRFRFDSSQNKTVVDRYTDTNGNGVPDTYQGTVDLDAVQSLWEAGDKLFQRDLSTSPRTIKTTLNPAEFIDFSTANASTLAPYLQASTAAAATNIINYIHGIDLKVCSGTDTVCSSDADCGGVAGSCVSYRSRTVTKGTNTGVWKLGDIVTSTPRVQSSVVMNNYHTVYGDSTYQQYTQSSNFKNFGTAYTGANDGMLHAFNFGKFEDSWDGQNKRFEPARLTLTTSADFGKERWTFIPKNVLPYLKYLMDPNYCHIYYVDASPVLFDAAVNVTTGDGCSSGAYWNCDKKTTYSGATTNLDTTNTSWRTILIGSLRIGGACKGTSTVCTDVSGDGQKDCVNTPVDVSGQSVGFSSYFALDVTNQDSPQLLWEFSNPDLGYSTTGPMFMRIAARKANPLDGGATSIPDNTKNGRWFVVLASGPTGPVDTQKRQFMARSDQSLKMFVLDLKSGELLRTIDSGIQNAFAGSLSGGKVDFDIDYQDDILYFGYTKKCTATNNFCTVNTWSDGGVLRLVTKEDLSGSDVSSTALNPANWQLSTVMSGIGPVSSSVSNLVKRMGTPTPAEGWLYFGTGRFNYKEDDITNQRTLFGIMEPCVSLSGFNQSCTTARTFCASPVHAGTGTLTGDMCGELVDVSTNVQLSASQMFHATGLNAKGWYINLESPTNTALEADGTTYNTPTAERVITDPVAIQNGAVFFTTFAPSQDICTFGGNTFLWKLKYDTGSFIAMSGTALLQVSTGEIKELNLKTAFSDKVAEIGSSDDPGQVGTAEAGGRRTPPNTIVGVPPIGQGLSLVTSPTPVDKVIHIQKK
jgi:type IV pilus assembly protein PilY1